MKPGRGVSLNPSTARIKKAVRATIHSG